VRVQCTFWQWKKSRSIRDFNARDVDHCNKLTETVAMARFRLMSQQSSR